jgi:hypothetical protein
VGYVFGKKHPTLGGQQFGSLVLNSMAFDTGMCLLPAINAPPLATGHVLDWQLRVLPSPGGLSAAFAQSLGAMVNDLPAPVWYPPGGPYGEDPLVGQVRGEGCDRC